MTQLRSWEGGQRAERVAFFVPTLNEAAPSIGLVIESIPVAGLRENGYETAVYVVDGRSVDRTREKKSISQQKTPHGTDRRQIRSTSLSRIDRILQHTPAELIGLSRPDVFEIVEGSFCDTVAGIFGEVR